jgi:glutamate-5-semialdehyde dehydrogenase
MDRYIDVLIPRGGKGLIRRISEASRIPVIKHYDGICHLYLAEDALAKMAVEVAVNSKCQRVEVCNALEKLLIHAKAAPRLLPELVEEFTAQGVELRGCLGCCELSDSIIHATDEDWTAEYLAPILAIKIVNDDSEAIEHINRYGSGHTDGIVTNSLERVARFVRSIDSSSVMINASTRLSGGGDYGMGAVVGISTDKLHARGPVGPNELTSYKWVAYGHGHLRA